MLQLHTLLIIFRRGAQISFTGCYKYSDELQSFFLLDSSYIVFSWCVDHSKIPPPFDQAASYKHGEEFL